MGMQVSRLHVFSGTGAANTAKTVSTDTTSRKRILYVTVAYSAAPTQTGVTVTLNSALGAAFDCLLTTGTANAQYTTYIPASGELIIDNGDAIDVVAPAAGGVITASIAIYTEIVY